MSTRPGGTTVDGGSWTTPPASSGAARSCTPSIQATLSPCAALLCACARRLVVVAAESPSTGQAGQRAGRRGVFVTDRCIVDVPALEVRLGLGGVAAE